MSNRHPYNNYQKFYNESKAQEEFEPTATEVQKEEEKEILIPEEPIEIPEEEQTPEEESAPVIEEIKESTPIAATKRYIVADTPKLNVREIPEGKVIKVIDSGEEVVLDTETLCRDGWYKIKSPVQGYVMNKYIKEVY